VQGGLRHPLDTDVAVRAVEFLYGLVTLDHGLTLGDVLKLLNTCPWDQLAWLGFPCS